MRPPRGFAMKGAAIAHEARAAAAKGRNRAAAGVLALALAGCATPAEYSSARHIRTGWSGGWPRWRSRTRPASAVRRRGGRGVREVPLPGRLRPRGAPPGRRASAGAVAERLGAIDPVTLRRIGKVLGVDALVLGALTDYAYPGIRR